MLEEVFDINAFNIYQDAENYYFFRALNLDDLKDYENKIITDNEGNIINIRTNTERCTNPLFKENDLISLEQVTEHIKMYQLKETNCISITSNANAAITYGRGQYKDKYILVKVPKKNLGNKVYQAGLYMLKEIDNLVKNAVNDDPQLKQIIQIIDNCKNEEDLNNIIEENEAIKKFFQGDINYEKIANANNYSSLNDKQNFEKNKIVLKLDVLNKNILNRNSNTTLIQTIGRAFSSMEFLHYGKINKEEIIEVPKELIDIFSLLQQVPSNIPYIDEVKQKLLLLAQNKDFSWNNNYPNIDIDNNLLSMEKIYNITQGKISYNEAINLYKTIFYLAKSKLRVKNCVKLLTTILENNPKYNELINYIQNNTYGIEPEITTRISSNSIKISESVSLNINSNYSILINYIKCQNENTLLNIINNPKYALEKIMPSYLDMNNENK